MVAAVGQAGDALRPLKHDTGLRFVFGEADREIEQRLVFHDPARLDAAGRGENELRLGVVDAGRQLVGGKAAKNHRMHRADPRAREHRDDGFGDHRHVDDDAVALADAEVHQDRSQRRDLVEQFGVADAALGRGDGTVVEDRRAVAAPRYDVSVQGVETGVARCIRKPATVNARLFVENPPRRARPVDGARGFGPKTLRIGAPTLVNLGVSARHGFLPSLKAFMRSPGG